MINLKDVCEERLTKENILKYVSEYSIYQHYIPDLLIGGKICSPLRKDSNPSFGVFIGKYGDLAFNDFRLGGGDCFKFVSLMENVPRYEAMIIINNIFQLNLSVFGKYNTKEILETKKPSLKNNKIEKRKIKIQIKSKPWSQKDVDYLEPLNVNKLDWIPIRLYWIDEQRFNTDSLAYAFRYGVNIYKIYQPNLNVSRGKWWTNIDNSVEWFGHDKLDYSKDLLFIASSNKDSSVIHQLDYNSIAPHTEAQIFSQEQYDYYTSKFKRIIIFYDNDKAGIQYAEKFSNKWGFDYIYLEESITKDPFAFVKEYSLEGLDIWLNEVI